MPVAPFCTLGAEQESAAVDPLNSIKRIRERLRGRGPPTSVLGEDEYPPPLGDARLACWASNGEEECWVGAHDDRVPVRTQCHIIEIKVIMFDWPARRAIPVVAVILHGAKPAKPPTPT